MTEPDLTYVRRLETLHAQIRQASAFLLDQDMWDRWGKAHASDQEIADRAARERQMIEQRDRAQRELGLLVGELRTTAPAAITGWVAAHDALLADVLERNKVDPNHETSVAASVATQERAGWQAVARGEQTHVDTNTFFIRFDRELYRRLFGMEP